MAGHNTIQLSEVASEQVTARPSEFPNVGWGAVLTTTVPSSDQTSFSSLSSDGYILVQLWNALLALQNLKQILILLAFRFDRVER